MYVVATTPFSTSKRSLSALSAGAASMDRWSNRAELQRGTGTLQPVIRRSRETGERELMRVRAANHSKTGVRPIYY
jgi:hypothetical protein